MKILRSALLLAIAGMAFSTCNVGAQTIIGDLNNFDTINDTGQPCYGFEIEIDGVHSTDITYTFDWNHYGAPKIREDNTDPANPKVFIRYESTKGADGKWGANNNFTNVPSLTNPAIPNINPPSGHTCTDTTVNEGCEHFGVGYYGTPTTVKYNWLVDDGAGGLVYFGTPVGVAAPKFTYTPFNPVNNAPAQVVAVIPAPVAPVANNGFGEPFWVKVVKTITHNANPLALADLVSDDKNGDGKAEWQHGEPDEVETEWRLLQARVGGGGANDELQGAPDDMGDGSEIVTRRYEFYKYGAALDTLDGETGEAMCSEVQPAIDPNDPLYLHGVGTSVAVTDANGNKTYVNCEAQVVVGNYIGAQMAGFAAAAGLGMIDHLQDGETGVPYTPRTVVIGGDLPYTIDFLAGSLPGGLSLGTDGVLAGTPNQGGDFTFTARATDGMGASVSQTYTLHIAGAIIQPNQPPVAQCVNVTVAATAGLCSAPALINNGSFDPEGGALLMSQFPVGPFSVGSTAVTLTATDDKGASASCAATVTVTDNQAPTVSVPASAIVEGTETGGATLTFGASALDNCSAVTASCVPTSGSLFKLGTTPVTCSATDVSGNTGSASFNITVKDTIPPVVTAPASMTVAATSAAGAVVTYPACSTTDTVDAAPVITYTKASGTTFPVGTTTVTCTATDVSGNVGAASFNVTVNIGQPKITGSIAATGRDASGLFYADLVLSNTGTGIAKGLVLSKVTPRVLAGKGRVSYSSPKLPQSLGDLNTGASRTIRLLFNVPSTVTQFSITESGKMVDVTGTSYSYSTVQTVTP